MARHNGAPRPEIFKDRIPKDRKLLYILITSQIINFIMLIGLYIRK